MEDRKPQYVTDRSETGDQNRPIPLADRRRLVRPSEPSEAKEKIFNDWASI